MMQWILFTSIPRLTGWVNAKLFGNARFSVLRPTRSDLGTRSLIIHGEGPNEFCLAMPWLSLWIRCIKAPSRHADPGERLLHLEWREWCLGV